MRHEVLHNGQYSMVYEDRFDRIWWDETTGGKVTEILGKENDPLTFAYIDLDGTAIQSEQPGRFFDVVWAMQFRDMGVSGSDQELNQLRWKVYQWNRNVATSTFDMLRRITQGVDVQGKLLEDDDRRKLYPLLQAYPADDLETAARLIADRKENIGAAIVREHPKMVEQLAPLTPGFIKFIHAFPGPIGIGSASRRPTIIEPILRAHDTLHPEYGILSRIGGFIVGEEESGGTAKPDDDFFTQMRWHIAHQMHWSGYNFNGRTFRVEDAIFIGDNGSIDMPVKRSMHHLIVNQNDCTQSYGPMTAIVPSFQSILDMAQHPTSVINPTLRRLTLTISK